ncbi:cupredoxin domain-containing protein [Litchfieldia salsa]|uniref:Cupredoxin-like domain-containing protein n=1 Tax=Litchfieldia salsa TaxID=930152 RepID=A0A1H0TCR4_9BACI|nr:cupredoxin domain-containing protein [Litchfieldia salsa]SDP51832.1 Cupredoxin-like domain-containing protein [Litchfieldia salsa]
MKLIFVRKKWAYFGIVLFALIVAGGLFLNLETIQTVSQAEKSKYNIHMVTGEFKSKTEDGKKIESYRWDPGSITVPQGEEVTINIYGVNGHEHPFYIEGTDIKGVVKKGEETIITVKFEEEGVYRLICEAHQDPQSNGPMIAYIVVD